MEIRVKPIEKAKPVAKHRAVITVAQKKAFEKVRMSLKALLENERYSQSRQRRLKKGIAEIDKLIGPPKK